ncbi:MAG: hypothetical protein AB1938_23995 [Myxococcota bacterium]
MKLLVVLSDDAEAHAATGLLHERGQGVSWLRVASLDQARRELMARVFDAVLVRPGPRSLSFAAFPPFLAGLARPPKLLVVGGEASGAVTLDDGSPEHLVTQALAVLGVATSELYEHQVLAELERDESLQLDLVRLPGSAVPLVRAAATRALDEQEAQLARRAAAARGPGLPDVVEAFWDDPRPHLLCVVPRGVTLAGVLERLEGVPRDAVLSLGLGLARVLATLHTAGVAAGALGTGRVWLDERGGLLLLGNGFGQLPARRSRFGLSVPGLVPPEEVGGDVPPALGGDAFRLGVLLVRLATGRRPFAGVDTFDFLQGAWPEWSDEVREAFGPAAGLLDVLLQFSDADRPRGSLLVDVLERVAPSSGERILRELVARSGADLLA